MQQVLGNLRLALLVVPLLILLVAFYAGFVGAHLTLSATAVLIISAIFWDLLVAKKGEMSADTPWYQQKMRLGNKSFMVYLLIMTGFWTVYLQIFVTLPVYIRDFVDSSDLVSLLHSTSPWLYDVFTSVNIETLSSEIMRLVQKFNGVDLIQAQTEIKEITSTLSSLDVRVPEQDIIKGFAQIGQLSQSMTSTDILALETNSKHIAEQWSTQYRQMNPATILSLDFLMIILFQISISRFIDRFKALPALIIGTAILSASMLMQGFAHGIIFGGLLVSFSVVVFAVGEMVSVPKSQEYVASFAPKDKAAMFMGYYFVALALGNLFAGLLSGWLYGYFAETLQQPSLMWTIIALLGFATCVAFYFFNKHFIGDIQQQQLAQQDKVAI
jgi:hypothetical protein